MAVKIAHTAAFELCGEGTCQDAKVSSDEKNVFCKQPDTCKKGECYCQLFRRAKNAAEGDPWMVSALNKDKEAKNEPDKWNYKCICVRPVLETINTEDGVDYNVRFELCGDTGFCALERLLQNISCTGKCPNEKCKCTLFALDLRADPAKAKWKLVAKGGKEVTHEPGYYYRCFCLK